MNAPATKCSTATNQGPRANTIVTNSTATVPQKYRSNSQSSSKYYTSQAIMGAKRHSRLGRGLVSAKPCPNPHQRDAVIGDREEEIVDIEAEADKLEAQAQQLQVEKAALEQELLELMVHSAGLQERASQAEERASLAEKFTAYCIQ
ncbi:hypothetical protein Nepgr_032136 [Nepenthes gracilis]|uniref:Uncharacterized protein n=1 Tax=Nepenthes gracilis TaxID=150966 RepID=A0AAD3TJW5_NEPGR|nr:hypothetical protein Nepgr_032136 [Nepenthes gracilis]